MGQLQKEGLSVKQNRFCDSWPRTSLSLDIIWCPILVNETTCNYVTILSQTCNCDIFLKNYNCEIIFFSSASMMLVWQLSFLTHWILCMSLHCLYNFNQQSYKRVRLILIFLCLLLYRIKDKVFSSTGNVTFSH